MDEQTSQSQTTPTAGEPEHSNNIPDSTGSAPQAAPESTTTHPDADRRLPQKLEEVKNLFLKILIGCLIAAAALAVVAVLVGKFNDTFGKALFTILLVAAHSLASFGVISNNERQAAKDELSGVTNTVFVLIVLSFVTSVFGVWHILPGEIVGKLYGAYGVLLFAALHAGMLKSIMGKQANIDKVVYANFYCMAVVVLLLLIVIFSGFSESLGSIFYRVLAAIGIIDATLTLVGVILHKIYTRKHPAPNIPEGETAAQARHGHSVLKVIVVLVVGYVLLQVAGVVLMALMI